MPCGNKPSALENAKMILKLIAKSFIFMRVREKDKSMSLTDLQPNRFWYRLEIVSTHLATILRESRTSSVSTRCFYTDRKKKIYDANTNRERDLQMQNCSHHRHGNRLGMECWKLHTTRFPVFELSSPWHSHCVPALILPAYHMSMRFCRCKGRRCFLSVLRRASSSWA